MDAVFTLMQISLALFSAVAGVGKLIVPHTTLAQRAHAAWLRDFQPAHLRLISGLEVCAAVGLLVPLFVPALAMLAILAAVGMALVMAGAMATHLRRAEYKNMVGNLLWLGVALFVAYGKLVGFAI